MGKRGKEKFISKPVVIDFQLYEFRALIGMPP